ncbi:MAG: hypothetical protein MI861_12330 [Pirellulales bacterium]|nr:hypothetical protein [Pirellulales bacterium]
MTLDPPGTIAVVGAGALGIEAALYGRFLGYDVTLFEAESVGHSLLAHVDDPIPMLPDRCLSPLAISALLAQRDDDELEVLPLTCGQWLEQWLVPLTQSDLLAGRLRMPARVTRIDLLEIKPDPEDTTDEVAEIPSDFRLEFWDGSESFDAEAVVLAIGNTPLIPMDFPTPAPYLFQIGGGSDLDVETYLQRGFKQIVELYAKLAGREDLDLYRPRRGE